MDRVKHSRWAFVLVSLGGLFILHQGLARTPAVERTLHTALSDWAVIRMEPGAIEAQVKESGELTLDLKGVGFRFSLLPRDLRSPRYRAEATGPDGVRRPLPPDEVTTYRGLAVVGQEIVQGRFTIDGNRFEGVVFTPGDWHFIESLQHFAPAAGGDEWVVYRQSDIQPGQSWRCGVSHRLQEGRDRLEARAAATDTTTTYTVEVATEADYEYVQYWGSAEAASREIRSVLNQVEGVYETELKLKLEIVYQHAWNRSSDPYSGTDGSELLDQFRQYWNDNFSAEGYDLAHLWTDRETLKGEDKDGEEIDLGGIAWRAEVCKRSYGSRSYGLTKRQYFRSSGIILTAHEIGHNFSAVHPNHEDPPVTSCDATIMQSGWDPPTTLTFCQFSRNQIRSHVSTYNSCLEAETAPVTVVPPSNLKAEALDSSQIRLMWRNDNTVDALFAFERRVAGGNWGGLVALGTNRATFIDAGLSPGTTYSYRATAFSGDGEVSDLSNTATARTLRSDPGGGGGSLDLTRWVIPTMANAPGRFGAYYRTKVILWNFDSDLDLTMRLYGPNGFVAQRNLSIDVDIFWTWSNFLEQVFDYRGAGAVEFSGNAPFTVSAEVYTTSSQGKYTTVVHNGPAPLTPYSLGAASVGVVTVDGATRTNAGVFNNSNRSQTVTARVHYTGSNDPDQTITFSLPPKGWAQKSVSTRGERGHIIWRMPQEAYLWVVSVDNQSNDGTLSVPAPSR